MTTYRIYSSKTPGLYGFDPTDPEDVKEGRENLPHPSAIFDENKSRDAWEFVWFIELEDRFDVWRDFVLSVHGGVYLDSQPDPTTRRPVIIVDPRLEK